MFITHHTRRDVRERKRETGGRLTNLPPVSSKNNKNKGNDELELFWVKKISEKKRKKLYFKKPFPNCIHQMHVPAELFFFLRNPLYILFGQCRRDAFPLSDSLTELNPSSIGGLCDGPGRHGT
jgi:hypothetical protein